MSNTPRVALAGTKVCEAIAVPCPVAPSRLNPLPMKSNEPVTIAPTLSLTLILLQTMPVYWRNCEMSVWPTSIVYERIVRPL